MDERRTAPRAHGMAPGTILLPGGGALDCFLQNWSHGGAHLLIAGTTNVPDVFSLESEPLARRRHAQVMWRRRKELGVMFRLPETFREG